MAKKRIKPPLAGSREALRILVEQEGYALQEYRRVEDVPDNHTTKLSDPDTGEQFYMKILNSPFENGRMKAENDISRLMNAPDSLTGDCKNFRKLGDSCASGCASINVIKGNTCPTDGFKSQGSRTCPCYVE